jgi:hypothetical protein
MKQKKEDVTLRVIPQLTISKRIVSLIAEEDKGHIKKGQVVKKINVETLSKMQRPFNVKVTNGEGYTPLLK